MAKFDLASVFATAQQDVPNSDTKEQIEYIDIDLIDPDPNNFYALSNLDELAANIEMLGLQQPLRVRPGEGNRVIIVSGHRRCAALRELVNSGRDDLRAVPCIRDHEDKLPALQELRLIYANSDTRKMSSSELGRQAERVEALLYQLQEAGYDFPGRMRDHVAEACKVSKSKLARLKVIRERLDKPWMVAYNKGQLYEATAYALARLPADHQQVIFSAITAARRKISQVAESEASRWGAKLADIDKLTCKRLGSATCINRSGKYEHVLSHSAWEYTCCSDCCANCSSLTKCKHACPSLADQVKALRADAREERRQQTAAKEALAAQDIAMIRKLWQRFGTARSSAGQTTIACCEATHRYYCSSLEKTEHAQEQGNAHFTVSTQLPYSSYYTLEMARNLIRVADLLGCSIDYLLCRTDNPSMAPDASLADDAAQGGAANAPQP